MFFFDDDARLVRAHEFRAADDAHAARIAEAWREGRRMELWQRDRQVRRWGFPDFPNPRRSQAAVGRD